MKLKTKEVVEKSELDIKSRLIVIFKENAGDWIDSLEIAKHFPDTLYSWESVQEKLDKLVYDRYVIKIKVNIDNRLIDFYTYESFLSDKDRRLLDDKNNKNP